MMTYDLNFFFIQSPSISLNKTVVIKTMISDKTVFHFQHCDHQPTLVIVVQLLRLPVVSLRLGLISVLGKHHCFLCLVNLDKFIRTITCFSVNSSFICCNVFLRCSFYMLWWLCRSLFPFYVFFWNLPSLRTMISLTFSMTCSFVPSVYYCRCFK